MKYTQDDANKLAERVNAGGGYILPEWVLIIAQAALADPRIKQLWLFGSRIKGTYSSDSDLDVALVTDWLNYMPSIVESSDYFDFEDSEVNRIEFMNNLPPATVEFDVWIAYKDDTRVWKSCQDYGVQVF